MAPEDAPRILVVEDDAKLAGLVQEYLETNGYVVTLEGRGDRAPERILTERPDLVVLDLMLPGLDGLAVCREVRPSFDGAILMLTARGEEVDEVMGLEIGADDYLAKPVQPRRLLARIQSLLRRVDRGQRRPAGPEPLGRLVIGHLVVDAGNRKVTFKERDVELTTAEFDLLWLLCRNVGRVVSRERIYTELRGIPYDGLDRSMDLRIARLRRKLGDDARQPRLIKSVRGAGYLLVEEP